MDGQREDDFAQIKSKSKDQKSNFKNVRRPMAAWSICVIHNPENQRF